MKKTFKFFAAALAIVAAASCAKENIQDNQTDVNDDQDVALVDMTFDAGIDSPSDPSSTKTTLVNGVKVHWSNGDNILVYRYKANTTNDKYSPNQGYMFQVLDSSISEDVAAFEGQAADHTMYAAIYPYASVNTGDSYASSYVFNMATLRDQTAAINNFPTTSWGCANISMTRGTNKGDRFVFENQLAYFKFSVESDEVYSIELSAEKTIHGYANNLSDSGNIGGTLAYSPGDDAFFVKNDNPITITNNGQPFVAGETYYVAIPAIKMEGLTMTGKSQSSAVLFSFKKTSFTPERNTIYNLGQLKVSLPDPAKVGDYFYSDGTYSATLDKSKTVVGVIFYVGDPTADDITLKKDYPSCTNGLVLGLEEQKGQLYPSSIGWTLPDGYMNVQGCRYSGGVIRVDPLASLKTGYNNTEVMRLNNSEANSLKYCQGFPKVSNGSVWYVPTIAEFDEMYKNVSTLNASLSAANATPLNTTKGISYWTTSEESNFTGYVAIYYFENGSLYDGMKGYSTSYIRPIFAF